MSDAPVPLKHGVRGTERTEPWLSLEDDDQLVRQLIARLAYEIYDSVSVGNPAPVVKARAERMRNPQVGDLVVETTAMHRAVLRRPITDTDIEYIYQGVGYLVKVDREPSFAEWDEEYEGRPMPTEDIWYVQYGPDPVSVCRWHNCQFYAIDLGPRDFGGLEFGGWKLKNDVPW